MEPQLQQPSKSSHSIILIVALFIILLIIAFAMSAMPKKQTQIVEDTQQPSSQTPSTPAPQKQVTVDVQKVDLSTKTGAARLPQGFPTDIPVDASNAVDSYTANYPAQKATQYSVSYLTAKSIKDTYNEYLTYMTKTGYVLRPDGKDLAHGFLYGTYQNNDLSIVITTKDTKTSVQITYLRRNK